MNKQFQDFLREERATREKQIGGLVAEIIALRKVVTDHDDKVERSIAVIEARVEQTDNAKDDKRR
jgi:hypothetical protein